MFEQSVHGEMVQFSIDTGLHIALKGRAGYSRCQWLTTTANRSNQNQKGFGAVYECTYVPHLGCSWLCTRSQTTYDKPCCARSCSHVDVSHERTTRVLHVSRRPHFFVRDRNTCLALQVFSSSCHCMRDSHHASQRETEDLAICETELFVLCTRR